MERYYNRISDNQHMFRSSLTTAFSERGSGSGWLTYLISICLFYLHFYLNKIMFRIRYKVDLAG